MTLDEIPRAERLALIRGYLEGAGWDLPPSLDSDEVSSSALGRELGQARQMVLSASVAEYPADASAYEAVVAKIERQFGPGVAVRLDEAGDPPGLKDWKRSLERL